MNKIAPPIRRVMLIEDETVDQMIYKRVLKRSTRVGDILTFSYAKDALTYLRDPAAQTIDLIFLDINMPRMNGFEFLEELEADPGPNAATSVIIMLTTSLAEKDRERAKASPLVKAFLNKPLTLEHVEYARKLLEEAKT